MSIPTLFDKMRENRRRFKPFVPEDILPGDYVRLKSERKKKEILHIVEKQNPSGDFVLSNGFTYKRDDFWLCTPDGMIFR